MWTTGRRYGVRLCATVPSASVGRRCRTLVTSSTDDPMRTVAPSSSRNGPSTAASPTMTGESIGATRTAASVRTSRWTCEASTDASVSGTAAPGSAPTVWRPWPRRTMAPASGPLTTVTRIANGGSARAWPSAGAGRGSRPTTSPVARPDENTVSARSGSSSPKLSGASSATSTPRVRACRTSAARTSPSTSLGSTSSATSKDAAAHTQRTRRSMGQASSPTRRSPDGAIDGAGLASSTMNSVR